MIWKDSTNDSGLWYRLRIEVNEDISSKYQLESGINCRFKLSDKNRPILWGTFGLEYQGVWVLNNKVDWELRDMPVIPITSSIVEASKNTDYYKFWSRFFAKQLGNENSSVLSSGLWTITIGFSSSKNKVDNALAIYDVDNAFDRDNPRWIDWGLTGAGSIVALKDEPSQDNGRVKWFRKLVREGVCPPVLVWYLNCIDGYIILDGHARLKAFQLESVTANFLVLESVIEKDNILREPRAQKNILLNIEKRQKHPIKSKMRVKDINKLLISAFDTRPYCYSITRAKARSNYEEKWTAEVRELGIKLNLNSINIEDMIKRIDRYL